MTLDVMGPKFLESEFVPLAISATAHPRRINAGEITRACKALDTLIDPRKLNSLPSAQVSKLDEALSLIRVATDGQGEPSIPLKITPYVGCDPATIPRRSWMYPSLYVSKFLTVTIAPAGLGKTGLTIAEALAMATGRDLLNDGFAGPPKRVWFWNGEDPFDELVRQVEAAKIHYGISDRDIEGRLFLDSGRDLEIKLAKVVRGECLLDRQVVSEIVSEIKARGIDVAIFDPFVTIHAVPENSNDAIDQVATALAQIANDTGCAMGIVAHTRKLPPGSGNEITSDDNRGASTLVSKARVARVLNPMTDEEARKAAIAPGNRLRYFRVGGAGNKQNLTPPSEDRTWRYNASVNLPNGMDGQPGDSVRVCTPWTWPDAFADVRVHHMNEFCSRLRTAPPGGPGWRKDSQADQWAGKLLASVLGHDPDLVGKDPDGGRVPADRHLTDKIQGILKTWRTNDVIHDHAMHDPASRKQKLYLVPGPATTLQNIETE